MPSVAFVVFWEEKTRGEKISLKGKKKFWSRFPPSHLHMGGSDENKHGVIGPMNPQGESGEWADMKSTQKNVMCNKKIPPPVPVHRPITRSFAAQLAENNPQTKKEVVMTMRTQGGDEAVLHLLNRTRELYRRRIQETASVDQLDSIFVECAITEAQPLGHEPTSSTDLNGTRERVTADAHGNSILEKSVLV
ncbi:unnamed protein product [Brassica oleracea]